MGLEGAPISSFLTAKLFGACKFKKFEITALLMMPETLEALETVSDVFAALGGNPGVEALTGGKPSTISMWRKGENFPSNTYVVLTDALRSLGKTAPASLWGMKHATSYDPGPCGMDLDAAEQAAE